MDSKGFKYWESLPTWAKGVIAVGGLAAVYFAANGFIKRLKSKADEASSRLLLAQASDDLKNSIKNGNKPTFSDSQYLGWADTIETAFAGCDYSDPDVFGIWLGFSDSGKVVANILKQLKNDSDFYKLTLAYGSRTYDQCGIPPFSDNFTGTLVKAIQDELSATEISKLNDILSSNGITQRF